MVVPSRPLHELALFAGGGGGLLASQWLKGWRTVCYVERATYPARIIEARIRDGLLDDAPVWDDVRTFDGYPWRGFVDVVTAGFPCQPFSVAGRRKAANDARNGWPDTIRIIREVRPRLVFLENVPGLLSAMEKTADFPHSYFGVVLGDLAASGYDASWCVLSAAELGAPHKRDRLWIAAHRHSVRGGLQQELFAQRENTAVVGDDGTAKPLAYADRPQRWPPVQKRQYERPVAESSWWEIEPGLGRVADGMAARVDRLKAIGNGQVPIVAATAWRLLTGG